MKETELKFKVGPECEVPTGKTIKIYQAYLDLDKPTIRELLAEVMPGIQFDEMSEARVRSIEEELEGGEVQCLLTLKGEGLKSREEREAQITKADFDRLKAESSWDLDKERTEQELAPGIKIEYDRYLGRLEGLKIVEIEFDPEVTSEERIIESMMEWQPKAEDVTEKTALKNRELAKTSSLEELEEKLLEVESETVTELDLENDEENSGREGIIKIAITGGPCGGKSEVLRHLQEKYGDQLMIMPEIATQLLEVPLVEGGVGIPGKDVEWTPAWQDEFQSRVIEKQLNDEFYITQEADLIEQGIKLVVCDRGIMDGAAYDPEGKDAFLKKYKLNLELCYSLYDAVIHLNSLATDQPELYENLKHTNPNRYEDAATARAVDERIAVAYRDHPRLIRISAEGELDDKIKKCDEILSEMANFEHKEETENEIKTETLETNRELSKT